MVRVFRQGELLDLGVAQGIVDKAGAWYSYNGNRIGQGKDNVRNFLKENVAMAEEIEAQIRAKLLGKGDEVQESSTMPETSKKKAKTKKQAETV